MTGIKPIFLCHFVLRNYFFRMQLKRVDVLLSLSLLGV